MQLASVRIFVTDLEAAARFYGGVVGLAESVHGDEVVVYRAGNGPMVVIEMADQEARDEKLVGRFTGIGFATDDADELYQTLTARGIATGGPPEKQYWGGILLHVKDPSDNTITFVQAE